MSDIISSQQLSADISFVVLHYVNYDITRECIDNLLKFFPVAPIVVVDNASPNKSGQILKETYNSYNNVYVIVNRENVGFARGNNIGCNFAKRFKSKFIAVLNSDVLINGENFSSNLNRIYSETNFDVLGPDIITLNGGHQNPIAAGSDLCSVEALKLVIKHLERKLIFYFALYIIGMFKRRLKHIIERVLPQIKKNTNDEERKCIRILNPLLFGACYVFSSNYIKNHPDVFYPKTFMYFEEDILWYQCMKRNEIMVYDSSISVIHKEGQSVHSANKGNYRRGKYKLKQVLFSARIFLQLLESDKAHE